MVTRSARLLAGESRCSIPTRIAAVALGLGCLAGNASASEKAHDDPRIGLVSSYDEADRVTWYEPIRDFLTPRDISVRAVMGEGDDGRRSFAIRVERRSDNPVDLRSLEFRVDGVSTVRTLKRKDARIDRQGCRVVERVFLRDQEELVRSIAAAAEVELIVTGAHALNHDSMHGPDLEEFRRMVRLYDLPGPPGPPSPEVGLAGEITNPELILSTRVAPVFPTLAINKAVQGKVILQAVVHKDGTVGNIQVLRSTACDCGFEAAAIAAVSKWRYTPGMRDGQPVDVYFTIEVDFKFQSSAYYPPAGPDVPPPPG